MLDFKMCQTIKRTILELRNADNPKYLDPRGTTFDDLTIAEVNMGRSSNRDRLRDLSYQEQASQPRYREVDKPWQSPWRRDNDSFPPLCHCSVAFTAGPQGPSPTMRMDLCACCHQRPYFWQTRQSIGGLSELDKSLEACSDLQAAGMITDG